MVRKMTETSNDVNVTLSPGDVKDKGSILRDLRKFRNELFREVARTEGTGQREVVLSYPREDLMDIALTLHQLINLANYNKLEN
jgi:hypothetical protein